MISKLFRPKAVLFHDGVGSFLADPLNLRLRVTARHDHRAGDCRDGKVIDRGGRRTAAGFFTLKVDARGLDCSLRQSFQHIGPVCPDGGRKMLVVIVGPVMAEKGGDPPQNPSPVLDPMLQGMR